VEGVREEDKAAEAVVVWGKEGGREEGKKG